MLTHETSTFRERFKIEKLRPQEIMDNEKKEMDNLKLQEQELMKFWAEKLREKVKIPIVEEKE